MSDQFPDQAGLEGGQFLANLLFFARLLRRLNIPVSGYQVHGLAKGLALINITSEEDFYNTSRTFLLHDISKRDQFDLAFDLFWSGYMKIILDFPNRKQNEFNQDLITKDTGIGSQDTITALGDKVVDPQDDPDRLNEPDIGVQPVYSPYEILRQKDFSKYTSEDFWQAKKLMRDLAWNIDHKHSRRKLRALKQSSYLDFRGSVRDNINTNGELIKLKWRRRKNKPRPLIVLCDISGSMDKYSQILLHFLYGMAQETKRIETFVFGTRLSRITLMMRKKSPNQVIDNLSSLILDWSGGTRIGRSIKDFNYIWARRVRCQDATVMIVSDGWDRGNLELLKIEMSRLSRMAHRLVWINPLAGSKNYQPLVRGIQTVTPYVDEFFPLSNLADLESLIKGLESHRV